MFFKTSTTKQKKKIESIEDQESLLKVAQKFDEAKKENKKEEKKVTK